MKTPQEIADDIYAQYENQRDNLILTPEGYKLDLVAAIEADRAQRADEMELPEPWRTALRVIEGDGDEYTDTVLVRFARAWDTTLTTEHTVTWETFVKTLVVVARSEEEGAE